MRVFHAVIAALVAASPAQADLEGEVIQRYRAGIVRIAVKNGLLTNDRTCEPIGTGFFIDDAGHVLTAAHNVLPCVIDSTGSRGEWKKRDLVVFRFTPNEPLEEFAAALIYADEQTDLALLRVAARGVALPLAPPGSLRPQNKVSLLTFESDQAEPAHRSVSIDALFNPSEYHHGLIDISGPDLERSASGAPLFDKRGFVAGVFTLGKRRIAVGEAVVPVSYAAPLFQMAGVAYPSLEVREVLDELRRDLYGWRLSYDGDTGNIKVEYSKRLSAGLSPVRLMAEFDVYTKTTFSSEFAFEFTREFEMDPVLGKKGVVGLVGIATEVDRRIKRRNEHRAQDRKEELGAKDRAKVSITVEFEDGFVLHPIQDQEIEF